MLDDAWNTSMGYWQSAYSCEVAETTGSASGGRSMLVNKKFDISGVFGFKIRLQFAPSQTGVRVTIESTPAFAGVQRSNQVARPAKYLRMVDAYLLGASERDKTGKVKAFRPT